MNACRKVFDATHRGNRYNHIQNHPNKYFDMSQIFHRKGKTKSYTKSQRQEDHSTSRSMRIILQSDQNVYPENQMDIDNDDDK